MAQLKGKKSMLGVSIAFLLPFLLRLHSDMPAPVFVQPGTPAAKGAHVCATDGCEKLVKQRSEYDVLSACWAMHKPPPQPSSAAVETPTCVSGALQRPQPHADRGLQTFAAPFQPYGAPASG